MLESRVAPHAWLHFLCKTETWPSRKRLHTLQSVDQLFFLTWVSSVSYVSTRSCYICTNLTAAQPESLNKQQRSLMVVQVHRLIEHLIMEDHTQWMPLLLITRVNLASLVKMGQTKILSSKFIDHCYRVYNLPIRICLLLTQAHRTSYLIKRYQKTISMIE